MTFQRHSCVAGPSSSIKSLLQEEKSSARLINSAKDGASGSDPPVILTERISL